MLKVGVLISNDGDPFVQKFYLWILQLGHMPIPIYEQDLYRNKRIHVDVNSNLLKKYFITLKTEIMVVSHLRLESAFSLFC